MMMMVKMRNFITYFAWWLQERCFVWFFHLAITFIDPERLHLLYLFERLCTHGQLYDPNCGEEANGKSDKVPWKGFLTCTCNNQIIKRRRSSTQANGGDMMILCSHPKHAPLEELLFFPLILCQRNDVGLVVWSTHQMSAIKTQIEPDWSIRHMMRP